MICEPCKQGRHTLAMECIWCDGNGRIADHACSDPECGNDTEPCPLDCDFGVIPGCKGDTWCDCQHRTELVKVTS